MLIQKNNSGYVTNNFTHKEYFNAAFGLSKDVDSFELSDKTISAGQVIRDYLGVAMIPTATYRTPAHDIKKGRSGKGTHTRKIAIDYDFVDEAAAVNEAALLRFHQEILNQGPLFQKLRALGVTGFGLYDGFLHIDSRPEGGKQKDQYGTYALWDERTYTKKNFSPFEAVETYFNQNDEDKGDDWKTTNLVLKIIAWVSVPTLLLILWYLIKTKKLKFKKV